MLVREYSCHQGDVHVSRCHRYQEGVIAVKAQEILTFSFLQEAFIRK